MSFGPLVYSYYGVAYGLYLFGPALVLRSPGAHATYWFMSKYNRELVSEPYALASRCAPVTQHASNSGSCEWDIAENGFVDTGSFWMAPGQHEISVALTGSCPSATARVDLFRIQRFGTTLGFDVDPSVGHFVLPISVTQRDAAMETYRVRVSSSSGCVHLREIRVIASRAEGGS